MKPTIFKRKLSILFIMLQAVSSLLAQQTTSNSDNLNTQGLYYAEFYDYIFRGHFEYIKMDRKSIEFINLFDSYLKSYGGQCGSYLPSNKVDIMVDRCSEEWVKEDEYGNQISSSCIKWVKVKSGLFANPDLYNAKLQLESLASETVVVETFGILTDSNAIGNSLDKIHKTKGLASDMRQFFRLNGCSSKVLKQFEENLKAFALQTSPIRSQFESVYQKVKEIGGPSGNQNYRKLLNDLVANQSKTWAMNKFVTNSISDVRVLSKDTQGRPLSLTASYLYKSFFGDSTGSVRITFENGLPKCIYFFDFPKNCKTPNSSIVASYATGRYND